MSLIQIHYDQNHILIDTFIARAGQALKTFRYFDKRSNDVIRQHIVTLMIVDDNQEPICYGHLDNDNGKVWLGIAVIASEIGRGWGNQMMCALIDHAKQKYLREICLSVDNDNHVAQALYEKYGFVVHKRDEKNTFYVLQLSLDIAVSTIAFMKQPLSHAIRIAQEESFKLEFSSGVPYFPEIIDVFLQAPVPKLLHNYFPPPAEPFVLNLASSSVDIRNRSIDHCIRGLHFSAEVGAPLFSAHAGFCIDPDCSELGKKINSRAPFQRDKNWALFVDAVTTILYEAERLGVSFLIENNVLAPMNRYEDGTNPLLCVDDQELLRLVDTIQHPQFGLLLDTAHLKVSANTLHFSMDETVQLLAPFIRAIHHSDNDGTADTNDAFDDAYWFLPYMPLFKDALHVLEVKRQSPLELKRQIALLNQYGRVQQPRYLYEVV